MPVTEKWGIFTEREGQWWAVNYSSINKHGFHYSDCDIDVYSELETAYKQLVYLATRATVAGYKLEEIDKWKVRKVTIS